MRQILFFIVLTVGLALSSWLVAQEAVEMVEESSTKVKFPTEVSFTYQDQEYHLQLTGMTVRKKFIVKVYAIAHYMENPTPGNLESLLQEALSDGKAKQITMQFVRGVGVDKITNAYRDGFKKNATDEEMKEIQALVDQFVGYHTSDVKKGDQYILRWLPGGVVVPILQGEEKPAITNPTFARVLWSIWLGEHSIVKREKLFERVISAE